MPSDLRSALDAAGFERYAEAVCAEWEILRTLGTADMTVHLKSACGVSTLGHRHRIAKLLLEASPSSLSQQPSSSTAHAPSAATPPSSRHGEKALHVARAPLPPHISAMLMDCEKSMHTLPMFGESSSVARSVPPGMPLAIDPAYPGLWRVHDAPSVFIVDAFLNDDECDALTRLANPLLRQSLTDGGESRTRTSRSCHLRKGSHPCPSVLRKVVALTRKPLAHMETPQVARYERGQFYEAHFDGQGQVGTATSERFFEQGGQRVCTCLIYLNDATAGGHTRFNRLGFEVAPRKGCAVIFFPGFADTGELDPRVLHEARPAVDTKYVCQIWIRERELEPDQVEYQGMGHRLLEALYAPK